MVKNDDTPLLGVRTIANELGYTPQQVRHFTKAGVLPVTRVGARLATTRRLLREWSESVADRARSELAERRAADGKAVAGAVIEHMRATADGAEAV